MDLNENNLCNLVQLVGGGCRALAWGLPSAEWSAMLPKHCLILQTVGAP